MSNDSLILIDLDHTLYDAVTPWKNLIIKIFRDDLRWKKFSLKTYDTLRGYHKVFDLFYENSFRHHWLSKELITLLLGIKSNLISLNEFWEDLENLNNRLALLKLKEYRPGAITAQFMSYSKSCEEFRKAIELVNEKANDVEVNEIFEIFRSEINLGCYDGVIDLLTHLKKNNYKYYLVSEGDYDLQLWKTKLLDINQFFNNKILVTELYKQAPVYLKSDRLIKKLVSEGDYKKFAETEEVMNADNSIRKYNLLRLKEDLFFYYAILNSININPRKPEEAYISTKIDKLIRMDDLSENKVIMLGDRLDKDILPIWKIKKNNSELLRIRIGKYKINSFPKQIRNFNYTEFENFRAVYDHLLRN